MVLEAILDVLLTLGLVYVLRLIWRELRRPLFLGDARPTGDYNVIHGLDDDQAIVWEIGGLDDDDKWQ